MTEILENASRILVAEDEMIVAMMLEDILGALGYEVVGPVARLDRALELAQRELLDFAVLDVNLNGEQVYPVADELARRGIPFAFTTGYGRAGLRDPYRDRPTLQKPFQQHNLEVLLDELRRNCH